MFETDESIDGKENREKVLIFSDFKSSPILLKFWPRNLGPPQNSTQKRWDVPDMSSVGSPSPAGSVADFLPLVISGT